MSNEAKRVYGPPVWCEPCMAVHPEGWHSKEWMEKLQRSTLAAMESMSLQAARNPDFAMADDDRARILARAEEMANPKPGPKIWMPGDPEDPDA